MKTTTSTIVVLAGFLSLVAAVDSVNITLYADPDQYTIGVFTNGIPTYTPVDDATSAWRK
jgi:hypothetical protein